MRPLILPALIEKGLLCSKQTIRCKTQEILLLFAEIDSCDPVLSELSAFLGSKQPKLVAACLNMMKEIIR